MSPRSILIIGGGIAGVSTAWWAARGGADVVLLERERTLGAHSSGLNAAILRTASATPELCGLARETSAFLESPPDGFSPVPLVDRCGLLLFEGTAEAPLPPWADDFLACGEVERLDPERARALAPHFAPLGHRAWFFPREGRIDISALLDAFARGARHAGAHFHSGAEVAELVTAGGAVHGARLTDGRVFEADRTVIAAGGWAGRLGERAGSRLALTPLRRHLLVTQVDGRVDPRWPIVWDERAGFYARPESGGLLLCACDQTEVDPDACVADPGVKATIARKALRLLPGFANAGATHFWAGMRTFAAVARPAVGPDPDVPGLFWVAGLGGHGMSTSAAVGRLAARALLADSPTAALGDDLMPSRSTNGARVHGRA